jgi:hypothetical protein
MDYKSDLVAQLEIVLSELTKLDELFSEKFNGSNDQESKEEKFMSAWNKVKTAKQNLLSINPWS